MRVIDILVIEPVGSEALARIAATDERVRVTDARGWFDGELRETWPRWVVQRYMGNRQSPEGTRQENDRVLAMAEIIVGGWPFPRTLRARAQQLQWYHQLRAGASNLHWGDLWGSDVIVTTSRGYGNTQAMAEYVLAGFLHFAKGLHLAYRDRGLHRFDHSMYYPVWLRGKTVCVVGAGGIGQEVARLCSRVGLRVIGTRRNKPAKTEVPAGFSRLEGRDRLLELLAESDFVVICCQWTPETTRLIGPEAFAAMRQGTVLVNVARGEIVDESALVDALGAGIVRGVALDVYVGEMEHEPDRRLWDDERVIITPHTSARTETSQGRGVELFCENLRAYLAGRPLTNVVDWERGY